MIGLTDYHAKADAHAVYPASMHKSAKNL